MQYSPDQMQRLIDAVEAPETGGTFVPGPHIPKKFKLKVYDPAKDKRVWKEILTTGCHQEAQFLIPYALPGGKLGEAMEKRGGGLVQVCAIDDNVGMWPRFQKAKEA